MNTPLTPFDFLAKNRIEHSEDATGWHLAAAGKSFFIPRDFHAIEFSGDDKRLWTVTTAEKALRIRRDSQDYNMNLTDADMTSEWNEYGALGGYRFRFRNFAAEGLVFDVEMLLFCALNWQTGEYTVEIMIKEPGQDRVGECRWPGGFTSECTERTVLPFRQGMLIPRDWPIEIKGHGDCIDYTTNYYLANTRVLYMPWWGIENQGAAAMMIVETPDDFGFTFHHPAGGPTELETRFLPSINSFRYARRLMYKTFAKGTYVTLAKAYRDYVQERGKFCSLKEKIARTPLVEKMLGSAVVHCGLLYEWTEGTYGYNAEDPAKSKKLTLASTIVDDLKNLYANGLRDAYLHLDGWGYKGYDALEPDSIPIGSEAGGEEGVKSIEQQCHSQNYLFALHQQYRDNYLNAASFREDHLFMRPDGTHQIDFVWCGGKNGLICSSFSPEYTRRNNRYFESIGLKIDGSYLDVFSIVPPDECNDPDHPVTRTECKAYRAECFAYIKRTQGIVSSEEAVDWTMPFIDLVHHAPWVVNDKEEAVGIPIPLFSLVYHDSLLIPWVAKQKEKGGCYIPNNRVSFLCALINAGIPYVDQKATAEDIAALEPLRALQKKCALMPMTGHRFLSDDYLEEETTFEDGTTVTVNHKTGDWKID